MYHLDVIVSASVSLQLILLYLHHTISPPVYFRLHLHHPHLVYRSLLPLGQAPPLNALLAILFLPRKSDGYAFFASKKPRLVIIDSSRQERNECRTLSFSFVSRCGCDSRSAQAGGLACEIRTKKAQNASPASRIGASRISQRRLNANCPDIVYA